MFPEKPYEGDYDAYIFFFFQAAPITRDTLQRAENTMRPVFVDPTLEGTRYLVTCIEEMFYDDVKLKTLYALTFFQSDVNLTPGAPFYKYTQEQIGRTQHYLYAKDWTDGKVCSKANCPAYGSTSPPTSAPF